MWLYRREAVALAALLTVMPALVCNADSSRLIAQVITEPRLAPRVASVTKSQYNEFSR